MHVVVQVPLMSRNNDTARNVHISANVLSTGLFLWQVGIICMCVIIKAFPRRYTAPSKCLTKIQKAKARMHVEVFHLPLQVPTGIEIVLKVWQNAPWP